MSEIHEDIDVVMQVDNEQQLEEATYRGLKDTIGASGPDYGHGQIYQLSRIILNKETPLNERLNAYRLMMFGTLALLRYYCISDPVEQGDVRRAIEEIDNQLDLFEGDKNGTKDNTKN